MLLPADGRTTAERARVGSATCMSSPSLGSNVPAASVKSLAATAGLVKSSAALDGFGEELATPRRRWWRGMPPENAPRPRVWRRSSCHFFVVTSKKTGAAALAVVSDDGRGVSDSGGAAPTGQQCAGGQGLWGIWTARGYP